MAFTNIKYQSESGAVYKMRVSDDKLGLAGEDAITAAVTDPNVDVYAGGQGRKRHGIHARGVRMSTTVGTAPNTFKKYVFVPCATKAIQTALLASTTVTYKTLTFDSFTTVAEK